MREVAALRGREFAAEYVRFETGRTRISAARTSCVRAGGSRFVPTRNCLQRSNSGFLTPRDETPGAVFTKRARQLFYRRRTPWQQKKRFASDSRATIISWWMQSAEKIVETAKRTGARVSGPIPLPTEKEVVTILRAVHKYKDSREQFEMRTHKRLIDILQPVQQDGRGSDGSRAPRRRGDRNQALRFVKTSRLYGEVMLGAKGQPITEGGKTSMQKGNHRQEDRHDPDL